MLKPIFPRWIYTGLKNSSLLTNSFKLEQKNASECGIFIIHHMSILNKKKAETSSSCWFFYVLKPDSAWRTRHQPQVREICKPSG